jgi:hypothetical protein
VLGWRVLQILVELYGFSWLVLCMDPSKQPPLHRSSCAYHVDQIIRKLLW